MFGPLETGSQANAPCASYAAARHAIRCRDRDTIIIRKHRFLPHAAALSVRPGEAAPWQTQTSVQESQAWQVSPSFTPLSFHDNCIFASLASLHDSMSASVPVACPALFFLIAFWTFGHVQMYSSLNTHVDRFRRSAPSDSNINYRFLKTSRHSDQSNQICELFPL
jgi:hypothetical protein